MAYVVIKVTVGAAKSAVAMVDVVGTLYIEQLFCI